MKFLLPLILLAGCATAPATQSDADRAGQQDIAQEQTNSPLRMDRQAEKSVTIKITMTGENARLVYQPNSAAITGDVDTGGNQTGQGSTDANQGATATQTPTASTETDASAEIPVK